MSQAIDRFGRIDTLVNNAGIFIAKPLVEYTDDDYAVDRRDQSQRLLPDHPARGAEMLTQGSGHIVQITTTLAEQGQAATCPRCWRR